MGKKNVTGFKQYAETVGGHDCSGRGGWTVIEVGATLASAAKYFAMLRAMNPDCTTKRCQGTILPSSALKRHYLVSRHLLLLVVTGWPRRGSRRHLNRCKRSNSNMLDPHGRHVQQASHNARTFPLAGVIEYHRRRAAGTLRSSSSSLAATFDGIRGEHEAMRM